MNKNILLVFLLFSIFSCSKYEYNVPYSDLLQIKAVIPQKWECVIDTKDFQYGTIPATVANPLAVITFRNPDTSFVLSNGEKQIPSLVINVFPIERRDEIMKAVDTFVPFAGCLPSYYDENDKYIIITSPCFVNHGVKCSEADQILEPLNASLHNYFENM